MKYPLRPMRTEGATALSADNRAAYVRHKSGAIRRIVPDKDGNLYLVNKLTKSQRKAQKRARHQHSTPA